MKMFVVRCEFFVIDYLFYKAAKAWDPLQILLVRFLEYISFDSVKPNNL